MSIKKWNKETVQSPLARARGLGSAHNGVEHWLNQRVTAIALIPLTFWLLYSILNLQGATHEAFIAWLSQPVNAVLMILFISVSFYHALLGVQVVVEDYIHTEWLKITKLIGQKLAFSALGIACVFAVLKIAL